VTTRAFVSVRMPPQVKQIAAVSGIPMNGGVSSGVAQLDLGGVRPMVALPSKRVWSNSPGPIAALKSATVIAAVHISAPRPSLARPASDGAGPDAAHRVLISRQLGAPDDALPEATLDTVIAWEEQRARASAL
jgi:hypothetical protein